LSISEIAATAARKSIMRLPVSRHALRLAAVIGAVALAADSPGLAQSAEQASTNPSMTSTAGHILQASEGEVRVRRPRKSGGAEGIPKFIIKVDRKYGDSSSFFMGMENIPPGKKIRLHHHPHAEEILFVHRGAGVARLGAREVEVREGATVYIPRNVSVGLHNTGTEPLSLVFIFPESDGMAGQMRNGSVAEGEPVKPFTPEELAAHVKRGGEHIVFDEPSAP
jgi:mannose-6-phosphate isomerase-like protein (cupin superfamily)